VSSSSVCVPSLQLHCPAHTGLYEVCCTVSFSGSRALKRDRVYVIRTLGVLPVAVQMVECFQALRCIRIVSGTHEVALAVACDDSCFCLDLWVACQVLWVEAEQIRLLSA